MFLDDIDTEDPLTVSHYFGVRAHRKSRLDETNDLHGNGHWCLVAMVATHMPGIHYSLCIHS